MSGAISVLVVDDHKDTRDAIRELLELVGHDVATACSGEEALAMLRGGLRPRVILVDLVLEGMSGFEFRHQQLVEMEDIARIPVVVISGVYDPRSPARELGAISYLRKPVNPLEVLNLVASFQQ